MRVRNEYHRQGLLEIGRIVATVLDDLGRSVRPGVSTAWLDDRARLLLAGFGASSAAASEYGFPGSVCVSVNDEVAHGIPGARVLDEGDMVKLDLSAGKGGFVADAARTVVVSPSGSVAQALADCARRSCLAAIANARAGVALSALGALVDGMASQCGFHVVRELCGHGLGRRTHERPEVPNFDDRENHGVLEHGMVIAIEPILSSGTGEVRDSGDGWTVFTADGALAAHHEETIIIGEDGAEVTTAC